MRERDHLKSKNHINEKFNKDLVPNPLLTPISPETYSELRGSKIDRSAYAALANKLSKGTPSQYWVDKTRYVRNAAGAVTASPSVYLYQTPSSSFSGANYHLKFYYVAKIEDAGAYTLNADVIHGFIPPMCSGLAYYLSLKYSPDTAQANKLIYEDEMARAVAADGSRSSTYITPQTFYGDGV